MLLKTVYIFTRTKWGGGGRWCGGELSSPVVAASKIRKWRRRQGLARADAVEEMVARQCHRSGEGGGGGWKETAVGREDQAVLWGRKQRSKCLASSKGGETFGTTDEQLQLRRGN